MNRFLQIIIAVIAVLVGYCTATAQGELPLVREGVKWHYNYEYWKMSVLAAHEDHYYHFKGSKMIDDKEYHICHLIGIDKQLDTVRNNRFYLRQEGKKVFLRLDSVQKNGYWYPRFNNSWETKEKECLIYDFSLNTGDTWKMLQNHQGDNWDNEYGTGNIKTIDSVKYIPINGINTKTQYVRAAAWSYLDETVPVVEGIGCLFDAPFPLPYIGSRVISVYIYYELVKFEDENGNVLYEWNHLGVGNQVGTSLDNIKIENNSLRITAEGAWTVMLYGSDGRGVLRRQGYGESQIQLDDVGSGVYVARLQTANTAKTVKLIR